MTVPAQEADGVWVITLPAVRLAVRRLIDRRTYPFFPGYVYLRQQASRQRSILRISADWRTFGSEVLEVLGAPEKKPYLKPFQEKAGRDDEYQWWNSNIPGSWSPSSLREGKKALEVISISEADGTYNLRPDHPRLAREHLLYGQRMSALDFGTFLFRDYGFISDAQPKPEDVIANFRVQYGVVDDDEFAAVYDPVVQTDGIEWFEYFGPATADEDA